MAISSPTIRTGLQVVLGILIVVMFYFLYNSMTEPWEKIERQKELTEKTRLRMTQLRTALVDYERDSSAFPDTLSMLMAHLQRDSLIQSNPDSVFGGPINLDSLFYSPRSGTQFSYAVNDTGRVETYLIEDPDSDDKIGTLSGDPTEKNVATWE